MWIYQQENSIMTLRLRRHFTTRIAFCAGALAFFGASPLPLIGPGYASLPARSASIKDGLEKSCAPEAMRTQGFSQEQKPEKKPGDPNWKLPLPFPAGRQNGQRGKEEQQKQDEPLLRIETDLVQIDVVVTDKQGKLARDLKRADFELFDDGKKQEITHFAIGTAAQPARWLAVEKKKPAEI